MPISSHERQALLARAREMPAQGLVGKAGLTAAVVQQLRTVFAKTELIKLRLPKDRAAASELIERIEREVPCACLGRLGFTAVFYLQAGSDERPGDSP
jgi:RNA-binding protein YhbY